MKISKETITALRNFADIQANMVFRPDQKLKTMSKSGNVFASIPTQEEWPVTFGLYDLGGFLKILSLVEDPDLEISETSVIIKNKNTRIEYFCSDPRELTEPPVGKEISIKTEDIRFSLSDEDFSRLRQASSVFNHKRLKISTSENPGKIKLSVVTAQKGNESANSFSIDVDGEWLNEDLMERKDMSLTFDYLKMLPGDYDVAISAPPHSVLVSRFVNKDEELDLTYFVTLDKPSPNK